MFVVLTTGNALVCYPLCVLGVFWRGIGICWAKVGVGCSASILAWVV